MDKFIKCIEKRADSTYGDQPFIYEQEYNNKCPWQENAVYNFRIHVTNRHPLHAKNLRNVTRVALHTSKYSCNT